ncbi:hypothetical protein LB503_008397 [Fusarium chuoi]|nr:hypothetical protein LB503_008397 [Fusarium chuoi]
MDVDGRVLRMDSFSKVLVSGLRMGWITASKEGPSGILQLIIWKLVDEIWGHEGYLKWLIDLRISYTRRRNALLAACEDYLPADIALWVPLASGMFLDQGVLFARGSWFRADPHKELKGLFLRVTFASAAEGDMCTAVQRLSAAIKKSFQIEL